MAISSNIRGVRSGSYTSTSSSTASFNRPLHSRPLQQQQQQHQQMQQRQHHNQQLFGAKYNAGNDIQTVSKSSSSFLHGSDRDANVSFEDHRWQQEQQESETLQQVQRRLRPSIQILGTTTTSSTTEPPSLRRTPSSQLGPDVTKKVFASTNTLCEYLNSEYDSLRGN